MTGRGQFDDLLVALRDRRAEFGAIDVQVVEQSLEIVFAGPAERRTLDAREDVRQPLA
jgi:hypothetical protein